jgi:hypothetical protein
VVLVSVFSYPLGVSLAVMCHAISANGWACFFCC